MAKSSKQILKDINKKNEEIAECTTIISRLSAIIELYDPVKDDLNKAYDFFYKEGPGGEPAGYLDEGKSFDFYNIDGGREESHILKLVYNIIIWQGNTRKFINKVKALKSTKEAELSSLKSQYQAALSAEAAEN